jgi:hypothetical protein
MIDLTKAIISLHPEAKWSLDGSDYSGLQWLSKDITKPTEEELTQEHERLETEATANAYKQQREAEYPDFKEYLDGIVKGDQAQIDKYIADCQAVKLKYPKGSV